MQLNNKRVLITGGSKGIGAAIARRFAGDGANIVVNGRTENEAARQVVTDLRGSGVVGEFIAADMAEPAQIESLVSDTVQALGGIDVLVHNAGGPAPGRIDEITPEAWMYAFDVHVHAAYHLCRFALPHLKQNDEGVILLVSSTAGIRGCPGAVAYGTVKGAIDQLTRMMACDLADDNIRVNCVAPGVVWTDFHKNTPSAARQHTVNNRIPLHRAGTPDDIAQVAQTLVMNDYLTGATFVVDGGLTMQITR